MKVFVAAVFAVLAMAPVALHSQTPDSDAAPVESSTDRERAGSSAATDAAPSSPVPAAAESQTTAANEDPFDYEASEQISEDLSVSFPVDI